TRSRPSPSGRRMSVRQRSKRSAFSSRRAPLRSDAVRVVRFMRLNVRLTSSSRSGSSSTTSTTGRSDVPRGLGAASFIRSPTGAVGLVLRGMLERVVTQVPEDLPQLVGIDAHLDVGAGAAYGEPGARPLHGLAELRVELFRPCGQRQALQARPLPPGVPLHVV